MKTENDRFKLREMDTEQLCNWIAGWNDKAGRGQRLLGEHELQRRLRQPDAVRSWLAIGISIAAFIISVVFHLVK
jgi:hypothetical protein